jgi:hypothetical protein
VAAGCADDEPESTSTGDSTTTSAGDATTTTEAMGSEIPQVEIVTTDFAFEAPESVPAGVVEFTLTNDGEEPHHVQLARLNDDVTMDDLTEALASGDESAALALLTLTGGVGIVPPGGDGRAILDLEEGSYVLLCFVEGADGLPHLAKGMVAPMEVVDEGNEAIAPPADGQIVLDDFSIEMPEGFDGSGTFEIVNEGEQPHEIAFLRVADGKTPGDVEAFFKGEVEGPPPFDFAGGMQAIPGEGTALLPLELEDGTYIGLCFVPDPETGSAHVDLGMITLFTIGEDMGDEPTETTEG